MTTVKHDMLKRMLVRRSFPGLMDLYEYNYKLIHRLVPILGTLQGWAISQVPGHPELYIKMDERSKFTTTVLLTYVFEVQDGEYIQDPELAIRIYHDARQAEAMSCRKDGFMALPEVGNERPPVLDCKWDSNLFLAKWLEYCLEIGHQYDEESMLLDQDFKPGVILADA